MISASESDEFVPFGRQYINIHPGRSPLQVQTAALADHGLPIVKTLKDISISRSVKKDWWKLRSNGDSDDCDEELYINEQTVVWSKGSLDGAGKVIKSFTVDTPVQDAKWCTFYLPVHHPETNFSDASAETSELDLTEQKAVCIIEAVTVNIFTTDGRDYVTSLPFPVSKSWPVKFGLLFERFSAEGKKDVSKTPKRNAAAPNLPVLFSMLHPLDEVAPVICRTGGTSGCPKISFVTEISQHIVFTSSEPSLIVTYDSLLSRHAVWSLRRAKPEEGYLAYGSGSTDLYHNQSSMMPPPGGFTPITSHSASGFSRHTISSQSPGISPFRSFNSRLYSPSASQSRINSPSFSKAAMLSRSQSPSLAAASLFRLQTPSPSRSPVGCPRTPLSASVSASIADSSVQEPSDPPIPEICLDHLWTENVGFSRDGSLGQASKVFLNNDFCGQQYLCYLVSFRHHLRCVKFGESNDRTQLIFGAVSLIQARDAVPLKVHMIYWSNGECATLWCILVESLNMNLVLDMNYNLVLYSGVTKMNQVHVAGLPAPLNISSNLVLQPPLLKTQPQPSTPFGSPLNQTGPFTSSRPTSAMDARFDDEVRLLSPVPTEFDSSSILEGSISEDVSFHNSMTTGSIAGLRDAVNNRVTLELMDGQLYRTSLPKLASSPLVLRSLEAIKQILPKDVAMTALVRWYCTRNAPGSINGQSEWVQFSCCLLGLLGYDTNNLHLIYQGMDKSLSPVVMPKKAKPSDQGSEEDWQYLLGSDHHQLMTSTYGPSSGLTPTPVSGRNPPDGSTNTAIDISAPLFSHLPALTFALHLVYEDTKLETLYTHDLPYLASLLTLLTSDMRCDLYVDHYCRDFPHLFNLVHDKNVCIPQEVVDQLSLPPFMTREPPSIYHWLSRLLQGQALAPYPYVKNISNTTTSIIALYLALARGEELSDQQTFHKYLRRISAADENPTERCSISLELEGGLECEEGTSTPGHRATQAWELSNSNIGVPMDDMNFYERAVMAMVKLGGRIKDSVNFGVSLPLKEAIYHCRHNPPAYWPPEAYVLIGREDLARQKREDSGSLHQHKPGREMGLQCKINREEDDGMEFLDKELLRLRFSEDLRVQEVRRLLQSSRPVRIALTQKPEVSDHEFIEEQERHLFAICIRTMALPVGRGMLTLSTYHPVPTETLPFPKLCLTGRSPPRNTTVDLSHIDTPVNMSAWPHFHNGVAAGLRIANSSQLDSTWITYNKPKNNELTNEHAGFLMGLGLGGHLSRFATLNVHDYLLKGHDMTSVGLLLGVSAGKRGTMDVATTRLLSIHVAALLPPTSTELDIPHNVQVAAVLGVGLVYQGTAHRHIAEVLLNEIGRPPGPEMENSSDRESYSLAAGMALGNVMLGRGSEAIGLSDLNMADQLYHYMVGAHKRPLTGANKERYKSPSYQIKEGDYVNVDVTSPGATLALGMMFFKTNNSAVAEWLTAPDTQFLLEFVRPDFLMLRMIARGLVMWDDIQPSADWINSNIPEIVEKYAFRKYSFKDDPTCDIDFETMSQAYCNIVAGSCLALAFRFAGSANQPAFRCLLERANKAIQLMSKAGLVEQAGRSTVENCLVVTVLSLAIVMSGTGNLEVLRLCRYLRSRVGPSYSYVLYGSHTATSMALGLLFLGGGRYSLSTSPQAVAAMVMAFFPKFPIHSNDNRYHLQAFRHLYVLAAEPRVLIPRDVDSNQYCYAPLEVTFKDVHAYKNVTYKTMAPCILPELELIKEVKVLGPRYWQVAFTSANWSNLKRILESSGYLYVKQRAGHLSYQDDPKGYHSVLSQSLTKDQSSGKIIQSADIKTLSSDPLILAFAEYLCYSSHPKEYANQLVLSRVLFECISQEKPEVLASHIALEHLVKSPPTTGAPLALWQVRIMMAFYGWLDARSCRSEDPGRRLLSPELLISISSHVQHQLENRKDVRQLLVDYLRGVPLKHAEVHLLGCLLTWHNLPHPSQLADINYSGVPCFAELYDLLRPFNLSTSSVMSILSALHAHRQQQNSGEEKE